MYFNNKGFLKIQQDWWLNLPNLMKTILTKGQTKSKRFFQANVSSKKPTIEFEFTTMKPQVDLFSFVF